MSSVWVAIDRRFHPAHLGFLVDILQSEDKRPIREQLEDRYRHGGGWRPMRTPQWKFDPKTMVIRFPGDPPFKPIAWTMIGDEKAIFYPMCSLLCVVQKNGDWEVTRVD